MQRPRFTIARQMTFVVVLAIDLVVLIVLYRSLPVLAMGLALSGMIGQAACGFFLRKRGPMRAFWAGFIHGLLLAMTSYCWSIAHARRIARALGSAFAINLGFAPGGFWNGYVEYIMRPIIPKLPPILLEHMNAELLHLGIGAVLIAIPQVLIGLVVGLIAYGYAMIGQEGERRSENDPQAPST